MSTGVPPRRPDRPRVLLLHGLGGSAASWNPLIEALGEDRLELSVTELPWGAMGERGWSHQVDAAELMSDVIASVPGGADVIVAHSFAANLVLDVLSRRTGPAPRAVVLISAFYRSHTELFDWSTIESYLHGLLGILDEGLRVSASDRLDPDVREDMAWKIRERIGPYGWMRFFDSYLRSPLIDTGAIDPPTLVINGVLDRSAPPEDGASLVRALPEGRLELISDTGHFPMIERPEVVAAVLRHFLIAEGLLPTETH